MHKWKYLYKIKDSIGISCRADRHTFKQWHSNYKHKANDTVTVHGESDIVNILTNEWEIQPGKYLLG